MYQYPYGDSQQLNLDWIINKIIELENQEAEDVDLEEISNALISLTYSSTQTYNISDIVFRDGHLYRCNTTISAPGETWDSSHWDQIMLGDTVANLVRAVAGMDSDNVFNESNVPGTHVTDALNALVEDIQYNNHWIQKKKNGAYTDAIEIEDTPSNNSGKLASSKAAYDLMNSITSTQRMFAPVLTSMIATSALYVGDYVIVNDALYRIISDIPNGSTLIPDTNCKRILDGERKIITLENDDIICTERSYQTLGSVRLTAGTWALFGNHDFSENSAAPYQDVFFQGSTTLGVTRNIPGESGGGAVTFTTYSATGTVIIDFKAYGYGTAGDTRTAKRIKILAIKLY